MSPGELITYKSPCRFACEHKMKRWTFHKLALCNWKRSTCVARYWYQVDTLNNHVITSLLYGTKCTNVIKNFDFHKRQIVEGFITERMDSR